MLHEVPVQERSQEAVLGDMHCTYLAHKDSQTLT